MTYNEKLAYLRSYRQQEHHIDTLLAEAERWRSRAKAMTAHYGVTGGKGGFTGFPGAVEKVLELKGQIEQEIDAIMTQRQIIGLAIQSLRDQRYQDVLSLHYQAGLSIQKVAAHLHYEEKYVYKLRRKAIKALPLERFLHAE